jgi:TusA-related sulfurtransferase
MSNLSSSTQADDLLDLRGTPCPINFVRTKLRLEQMPPNSVLEVWLDAGEPIEQVPNSLKVEGYDLQSIRDCQGFFSLLVSRSTKL